MTILQRFIIGCLSLVASVAGAVQPNATDQTLYFGVLDADGNPGATATINAAISSISINYKTSPTTAATTTSLTALASATTAHTDNRAYAVAPGLLRVDFPDAPWATGVSSFPAWLTFSGGLSAYSQAGISQTVTLGYGLQSPSSDLATQSLLTATASVVNSRASQTTADSIVVLLADATNGLAAIKTAAASASSNASLIQAKLPSSSAKMAGEGTTAKNLDQVAASSESADQALQRLRNHESTTADGAASASTIVLASFPTTPDAYIGSTVLVGTASRTITAYTPAGEDPAEYTLNSALSPYPSTGTAVTIYGDPQAALIAYEAATVEDVEAVTSSVTVTAEDIDKSRTFTFPRQTNRTTASEELALSEDDGPIDLLFDLDGQLHPDDTIASAGSATVTLRNGSASTGFTVGTPRLHTSKRKVVVPITAMGDAGSYAVNLTFTTAQSQTLTRKGKFTLD